MLTAIGILLAVDLFLYLLVSTVDSTEPIRRQGHVPMWIALPMATTTVIIHAGCSMRLMDFVNSGEEAGLAVASFAVFGFLPISAAVRMVSQTIASGSVDGLYGWNSTAAVAAYDLSKAHQLARNQDIVGAIREYRRCFEFDNSNMQPLFGIAMMFEVANRPHDAVETYRDIIRRSEKGTVAWVTAAYQLAMIYENRLCDPIAAHGLFQEVVRWKPYSDVGHLAQARLNEQLS